MNNFYNHPSEVSFFSTKKSFGPKWASFRRVAICLKVSGLRFSGVFSSCNGAPVSLQRRPRCGSTEPSLACNSPLVGMQRGPRCVQQSRKLLARSRGVGPVRARFRSGRGCRENAFFYEKFLHGVSFSASLRPA